MFAWFLISFFSFCFSEELESRISFSTESSAIEILKGGLTTHAPLAVTGTLIVDANSALLGDVSYSGGRITTLLDKSTLTGVFKQDETGTIFLLGNALLSSDFGLIKHDIIVTGTDNRIEGGPFFKGDIIFNDLHATLTMAVHTPFDKNMVLNGGTLYLENDLVLGQDARFIGPGTIVGNGSYSLSISGTGQQWIDNFTFVDMRAITLLGSLTLSGTWSFTGVNTISGSGATLELNEIGILQGLENSITRFNSVTIRGFTQNSFVIDPTAQFRFSNSYLNLVTPVNMKRGTIYVEGGTTFMLRKNDFVFTEQAKLAVDSVTLWVDSVEDAGLQLFTGPVGPGTNLDYINGGTIKQVTDQSKIDSLAKRLLLSGFVTQNITLDQSFLLNPNDRINYVSDSHFRGGGATIMCTPCNHPQIIFNKGVVTQLDECSYLRISTNTIDLQEKAVLKIGPGIIIEITEDVQFSTGSIVMVGTTDVCTIRGIGGRKKLILAPTTLDFAFSIGSNTLVLEDIELIGTEYISSSKAVVNNAQVVGALALLGSTLINIVQDSKLNFLVQGPNAGLRLLNTNVQLLGNTYFGDAANNILNISFALQHGTDTPVVKFGNQFCVMSALGGKAGLVFHDSVVKVTNLADQSIVAGERSYLSGGTLYVDGFPIKQSSTYFTLENGLKLLTDTLTSPLAIAITTPRTFFDWFDRPITAYELGNRINDPQRLIRAEAEYLKHLQDVGCLFTFPTRAGIVPKPVLRIRDTMKSERSQGAIALDTNSQLLNFSVHPKVSFVGLMTGQNRIKQRRTRSLGPLPLREPSVLQSPGSETVYDGLKVDDMLYVSGIGNVLAVHSDFECLGQIVFLENSELTIQLHDGAHFSFGPLLESTTPDWTEQPKNPYQLTIPSNCSLNIVGNGYVTMSDGSTIIMEGTPLTAQPVQSQTMLFDDDRAQLLLGDFAQFLIDQHRRISFVGQGKIMASNSAEFVVSDGDLRIGSHPSDYFDVTLDRRATLKIATPKSTVGIGYAPAASVHVNQGFFNFTASREGRWIIGNKGTLEMSLLEKTQTSAFINAIVFASDALLQIDSGGQLLFGKNFYAPVDDTLELPVFWNNLDGRVQGTGFIGFVDNDSGAPVVTGAQIQPITLRSSAMSNADLCQVLTVATQGVFTHARDYIDLNGVHYLVTSFGITVKLLPGDRVTAEDATTGVVTGVQIDQSIFKIFPGGQRVLVV